MYTRDHRVLSGHFLVSYNSLPFHLHCLKEYFSTSVR